MTIAELITALQALPDHSLRVVVRGYEDGCNDVVELEPTKLKLNYYREWYDGRHKQIDGDAPFDAEAIELVGG